MQRKEGKKKRRKEIMFILISVKVDYFDCLFCVKVVKKLTISCGPGPGDSPRWHRTAPPPPPPVIHTPRGCLPSRTESYVSALRAFWDIQSTIKQSFQFSVENQQCCIQCSGSFRRLLKCLDMQHRASPDWIWSVRKARSSIIAGSHRIHRCNAWEFCFPEPLSPQDCHCHWNCVETENYLFIPSSCDCSPWKVQHKECIKMLIIYSAEIMSLQNCCHWGWDKVLRISHIPSQDLQSI